MNEPRKPSVLVVDDKENMLKLFSRILGDAYAVTTAADGERALGLLASREFDVVVTDIQMPGADGFAVLREVKRRWPATEVVLVTAYASIPKAVEAMREGVLDFLEKPFDDELLLAAVGAALRRDEEQASRRAEAERLKAVFAKLSARERDVLAGLVAGKANKVIAFDLGISPRTVEIYRANVMAKMQAGSLSELVRMALQAGVDRGSQAPAP